MGGIMSSPKPAKPSTAQVEAQQAQLRLAEAEANRLARAETEAEAARRARAGRVGGRNLLLNSDIGISEEDRAPKTMLGG
jgi:hypothetical protein